MFFCHWILCQLILVISFNFYPALLDVFVIVFNEQPIFNKFDLKGKYWNKDTPVKLIDYPDRCRFEWTSVFSCQN